MPLNIWKYWIYNASSQLFQSIANYIFVFVFNIYTTYVHVCELQDIPAAIYSHYYTPRNEVRGVYWIHPVCPSVCPLTFRVRPVASTIQDGFFPYLVLIINSMRGCVAYDDRWPWLLSSKSFGDGGGRPSSVMSLGVTSVGGHSHGHPASPIGVGSSWEDIDPRSPEPLVVRGGWLWLIWVVRWTT